MKTNLKKILLVIGVSLVLIAALAVSVFAVRTEFEETGYTDITPENGWVLLASPDAKPDDDGKDIDLYKLKSGSVYFNEAKKTVVFVRITKEISDYGDWTPGHSGANGIVNAPGYPYMFSYWTTQNSAKVEHVEIREGEEILCLGYALQNLKHVKDVKFGDGVTHLIGSKTDTGPFVGMESLTTVGHGKFAKDGTFTPTTFKEGVVDLTGFTQFTPLGSLYDDKPVTYFGAIIYNATSVTEVIFPKTLKGVGSYTPAVGSTGAWSTGKVTVNCEDDEFGGEYSGIIGKVACAGATSLIKVTIPEEVTVKVIEKQAFAGAGVLRCITIKGKVDPNLVIDKTAFTSIINGCIIQCSRPEDIETVNKALEAHGITNVRAVSMDTQPLDPPVVTKLPKAPVWEEFDPAGATSHGSIKSTYSDNYWAYYENTKTLKIFAKRVKSYNETGNLGATEDGGWTSFKDKIEHVVIGPKIHKLDATLVNGMTSLKDICMTVDIAQASGVFTDCKNLTTIWLEGMERVEGQACLASAKSNFKLNFKETSVKTIFMGSTIVEFAGNITPGATTETLIFDNVDEKLLKYGEEMYINIANSKGEILGKFYVAIPEGLPSCGDTAVYEFDEKTGTLTIHGKGAIADVANYWGGGSKNQFWFDIRDNIKHVVIGDYISTIGKYAFTECKNLETVQLPAREDFVILNAAFEQCFNLKSIYIKGSSPVEGTLDLSTVNSFESYTFSKNYLIANIVINEEVEKIGSSVFEECVNLAGVYGAPGSYAEEYAKKNELTFYDSSANTPKPVTCTPPAAIDTSVDTDRTNETDPVTDTTAPVVDTDPIVDVGGETEESSAPETEPADKTDGEKSNSALPIIIVILAVVVVAVVVVVILLAKKKAPQKKD